MTMNNKLNAKDRKKRFDALFELGCCICQQMPHIHHLIGIKYRGLGQKSHDRETIPLCMNHHTGSEGIHTLGKRAWEKRFNTQEFYLDATNNKL